MIRINNFVKWYEGEGLGISSFSPLLPHPPHSPAIQDLGVCCIETCIRSSDR
jgi:hypothetical protein